MFRNVFIAGFGFLSLCLSASAETIKLSVPDIDIPYTVSSASFSVMAEFTGSYTIDSYSLDLALTPRGSAAGVTFNGATEAAFDYIFPSNVGWSSVTDNDFEIAGDDGVSDDAETIADTTKHLIAVSLNVSLTAANIGDQYDVTFVDLGGLSEVYDDSWNGIYSDLSQLTFRNGVVTIVPEPMALEMLLSTLGVGVLWFCCRQRRKKHCMANQSK